MVNVHFYCFYHDSLDLYYPSYAKLFPFWILTFTNLKTTVGPALSTPFHNFALIR